MAGSMCEGMGQSNDQAQTTVSRDLKWRLPVEVDFKSLWTVQTKPHNSSVPRFAVTIERNPARIRRHTNHAGHSSCQGSGRQC